jgi:hypothetical protein
MAEAEEWMNDVAVQEGTVGEEERMMSVRRSNEKENQCWINERNFKIQRC